MESSKNGSWIIPYKKFSMVRVNFGQIQPSFPPPTNFQDIRHSRETILYLYILTSLLSISDKS